MTKSTNSTKAANSKAKADEKKSPAKAVKAGKETTVEAPKAKATDVKAEAKKGKAPAKPAKAKEEKAKGEKAKEEKAAKPASKAASKAATAAKKSETGKPAKPAAKAAKAKAESPKAKAEATKAKAESKDSGKKEKAPARGTKAAKANSSEQPAARKRGRPRKEAEDQTDEDNLFAEEEAGSRSRKDEFDPNLEEEPILDDDDFDLDDDEPLDEPEVEAATPKRKPRKAARKRRSRQLPRVPDTLRAFPAWAEAWTALAEAGIDAHTIPAVLRDASYIFLGLNELAHSSVEALFQYWEVPEVPAGIESILEEAFLSQQPHPERKQQLEVLFREILAGGSINDALAILWTARHVPDWRQASRSLQNIGSAFAENIQLFALAREIIG